MKRFLSFFVIFFISCSYGSSEALEDESLEVVADSTNVISETTFNYIDTSESVVTENFTDKKTIIIFWADYWGVCRRELPVLEKELANISDEYDVIALAHSQYEPTMEWVNENLNGELRIGFSTPELRDYFKIVGQPISIILDTNGEIISRTYGEIDLTNF